MITVTPLNTNQYNEFTVGDIITAYHSGFHRIIGFNKFCTSFSACDEVQVEYVQVLYNDGRFPNNKKKFNSCGIGYCKVVGEQTICRMYQEEVEAAATKYKNISNVLNSKDISL
jgi:hypothetical protein